MVLKCEIMNITQPMDFPTIMHYELRIMNLSRHARPMRRTTVRLYVVVVHQMWKFPTITHYELCIMNYPDTHVRASLREGVLSDVWNFPTITHYAL